MESVWHTALTKDKITTKEEIVIKNIEDKLLILNISSTVEVSYTNNKIWNKLEKTLSTTLWYKLWILNLLISIHLYKEN